jgi:hypothetical protein
VVTRLKRSYGVQTGAGGRTDQSNVNAKASTRIEKLDLEQSIGDALGLSDQLIQPLFGNRAHDHGMHWKDAP